MELRNRFQGMNSATLCSLAGRYDNPIPTRFLAPLDCLKIPAQASGTAVPLYMLTQKAPQRLELFNCGNLGWHLSTNHIEDWHYSILRMLKEKLFNRAPSILLCKCIICIFPNFSLGGPFVLRGVITIEVQKTSYSDCIMSML
jgi:hypothetical protein